jgi:hypothetical protein
MIHYSKDKLDNGLCLQALKIWVKKELVPMESIPPTYLTKGSVYKPYDWLKRMGLYLLTFLAINSTTGFIVTFLAGAIGLFDLDGIVLKVLTVLSTVNTYRNSTFLDLKQILAP